MAVYLDNAKAKKGRVTYCHLFADTDLELHALAADLGVARCWFHRAGTARRHYDLPWEKRRVALLKGVVAVSRQQAVAMMRRRSMSGSLGPAHEALDWLASEKAQLKLKA